MALAIENAPISTIRSRISNCSLRSTASGSRDTRAVAAPGGFRVGGKGLKLELDVIEGTAAFDALEDRNKTACWRSGRVSAMPLLASPNASRRRCAKVRVAAR